MAARAATRHNRALREIYQRLRTACEPAKAALVAVMRKLITTLNAIVRAQKPWSYRPT